LRYALAVEYQKSIGIRSENIQTYFNGDSKK
jgi:hypothetical protein